MDGHVLQIVGYGVVSWTVIFLLVRNSLPKRSFEFCSRIVSTLHAASVVILASLSVEDWSCPVCPLASYSSTRQMETLAFTLSYMIYDLICCLFDKQVHLDNTIHHLVCIVGIGAGLSHQKGGSELVAALWISEISSPFLHLREFVKELGYKDTDINLAADILFALIFSFGRMVCGPYLTWLTVTADNPLVIKVMAMGLQIISSFWFCKIVRMARRKLSRRVASSSKVV